MKHNEASTAIEATSEAIWEVLVDAPAWPSWDSGVVRARASGGRHDAVQYSGPMLPLIWRSMPDMGPSFEQFAQGLKRRVENGSGA